MPTTVEIWVVVEIEDGAPSRTGLELLAGARTLSPALGGQVVALTNDHDQELVVRLERAAPRDDALTAARAAALALFRELFPGEVLSPGQLVSVSTVTFLVTALSWGGSDFTARFVSHRLGHLALSRIRDESHAYPVGVASLYGRASLLVA